MRQVAALATIALVSLVSSAGAQSAKTAPPRWAAAVDAMMARELARTQTPGAQIAVVVDGRLVYTKGYGVADIETGRPVTERTLFQTGSVAKLFTGVLVAQLASAGVVDVRAPISRWAPELAGRKVGDITLHQLLTHTSGLGAGGVPWGRSDDAAADEQWRALGDTALVTGLAGAYTYSNPGYSLAGWVAERAAKRPFATLMDSLVLRPLGMMTSTHRPSLAMTREISVGHSSAPGTARNAIGDEAAKAPPPIVTRPMPGNSAEWGAGFLYTSAAEEARLAIAMMNGGAIDGAQVIAPEALRMVTGKYVERAGLPGDTSGYGMYTSASGGPRSWFKGGSVEGYRALVTMWPDRKLAIVVNTNRLSDVTTTATEQAARIVAGIAPPKPEPRVAEREPTAAERAALVGAYRVLPARTMEVRETEGRLELRRGRNVMPIRMVATDRFVVTPPGEPPVTYYVVRDASGAVRFLQNPEQSYPRVSSP